MFLYIFKIIIKLIITSSRFDPGSTSARPQNPWTSPFYGSMNGPGLKTLVERTKMLLVDQTLIGLASGLVSAMFHQNTIFLPFYINLRVGRWPDNIFKWFYQLVPSLTIANLGLIAIWPISDCSFEINSSLDWRK